MIPVEIVYLLIFTMSIFLFAMVTKAFGYGLDKGRELGNRDGLSVAKGLVIAYSDKLLVIAGPTNRETIQTCLNELREEIQVRLDRVNQVIKG